MSDKKPLYQVLARKIAWDPAPQYRVQRNDEIARLLKLLPSGSGWDEGTKLSDSTNAKRIQLHGAYHHMNPNGFYDGWTEHSIVITPSLAWGFEMKITGPNRNGIKEHLHEIFDYALRELVDEFEEATNG